jgi:hypothetical protein
LAGYLEQSRFSQSLLYFGINPKQERQNYMKLGIDYTPKGLLADYCVSCTHPETGKTGSWLFIGDSHKTGEQISPFFPDSLQFFQWARDNQWRHIYADGRPFCMIKE